MCPICWMTPRALPGESKSWLSQLSHKKLIGVNEEFFKMQRTIKITGSYWQVWNYFSQNTKTGWRQVAIIFQIATAENGHHLARERGRRQSKPGVGSRYRSLKTRQMMGLRLSQDRRESLVLFWIPEKTEILFNPFYTWLQQSGVRPKFPPLNIKFWFPVAQGTSYMSILQPPCFCHNTVHKHIWFSPNGGTCGHLSARKEKLTWFPPGCAFSSRLLRVWSSHHHQYCCGPSCKQHPQENGH